MSKQENTLPIIETKDLLLRPFQMNDVNDFYEYARRPEIGPKAGWKAHPSKDYSAKILKSMIEQGEVYAIVLKQTNTVIGSIGLHKRPLPSSIFREIEQLELGKKRHAEIGYVLSSDYWRKGYMTQAVSAVIYTAFSKQKLDFLFVGHNTDNIASQGVIEKCGFRFIAEAEKEYPFLDGKIVPCRYYFLEFDSYWKPISDKEYDEITIW